MTSNPGPIWDRPSRRKGGLLSTRDTARNTAYAAGYIGFSYLIGLAMLAWQARGRTQPFAAWAAPALVEAALAGLAVFLGWTMWRRQPRWAAIVILVWAALELLAKIGMAAAGDRPVSPIGLGLGAATIAIAARGVQATRRLQGKGAAAAEVFD